MIPITLENYLGPYAAHPEATPEVRARAQAWLDKVNAGLALAELDGVRLYKNPFTGSHVAGTGNGGFRPSASKVGAADSRHKRGSDDGGPAATDVYDPQRELCAWSLKNRARLQAIGIVAMEDPRWTPNWCHWQGLFRPGVKTMKFCYIPSNDPPLAAALPGQVVA